MENPLTNVPLVKSKFFFDSNVLEEYTNALKDLDFAFHGVRLLTGGEFLRRFEDISNQKNPKERKNKKNTNDAQSVVEAVVARLLRTNVCRGILKTYERFVFTRALNISNPEFSNYDILFLMQDEETKKQKEKKEKNENNVDVDVDPRNEFFAQIKGFVIVQLKKCGEQYFHSLNLMCIQKKQPTTTTTTSTKPFKGGQLLMGAFLFCLFRKKNSPPVAILELAHAYLNLPGLCMYEKFGFAYDASTHSCFTEYASLPALPMRLDVATHRLYLGKSREEKERTLISIVAGTAGSAFPKSKICDPAVVSTNEQYLLGLLKILLLCMENKHVHYLLQPSETLCQTFRILLSRIFPQRENAFPACTLPSRAATQKKKSKLDSIFFPPAEIKHIQTLISQMEEGKSASDLDFVFPSTKRVKKNNTKKKKKIY